MSLEIRKLFLRFSHTSVFNSRLILFVLMVFLSTLCKYFFQVVLTSSFPPPPPINIKHI